MPNLFAHITKFIKELYPNEDPVPLHAPRFIGNEKKYLVDCIDTTFVSYVGQYVCLFEGYIRNFTGAKYAVATVNGTEALHLALILAGVKPEDEILTQALTFVATANAITYCHAHPVFLDVERPTMGLDPEKLETFLGEKSIVKTDGSCYNRQTGRKFSACVPMHTFGHPVAIDQVIDICRKYHIPVVEDSAEALGSFFKGQHTGTFGDFGILSFNGNKPVTAGGGGMIITNDESHANQAKHLSTTAKQSHPWEFIHDQVGYNFRMPNINAAVGCAQMEKLSQVLENKRQTALLYKEFFNNIGLPFISEPENAQSNYWLNGIILKDRKERDKFLDYTNNKGVQTRPIWRLMNNLPMYQKAQCDSLETSKWLVDRVVNIPSSVRL